jgi:hypothetical protein
MAELAVIFRTPSQIEADVVRGLLETHGITAMIASDLSRTPFPISVNELRVMVQEAEADRAVRIIESHREEPMPGRVVPFGGEFAPLERAIGYRFRDRGLLEHALTHRSRVHEDASGGVFDNESMEFLGDSLLGFAIADLLFRRFPEHNEGQKSKLKASIVSAAALARLAESIGLGDYLILGRGEEKTGGRKKAALIADCYEALIAAIYLDGGLEPARGFIERQFARSSTRRRGPARSPRSPRTTSRRSRSGSSGTIAACPSTGWPPRSARRIGGGSRSSCWSAGKRWPAPRGRARRRRRRPPRASRWNGWWKTPSSASLPTQSISMIPHERSGSRATAPAAASAGAPSGSLART